MPKEYQAYKEELKGMFYSCFESFPESNGHITFYLPVPASASKKKRDALIGTPCQKRPDIDNLEKTVLDALVEEDCKIWDLRISKLWGESGKIVIEW